MKKILPLGVPSLILCLAIVVCSAFGDEKSKANSDGRNQLIGAWRLAWLEEPDANGNVHKADCSGLLIYTPDGHMSVQVMFKNSPTTTSAAQVQYAQGGYEASFGTYQVNEDAHSFTFHVEGALVRNLVGKDLLRAFEISGKQMIVKSTDANERWRVAWERY
jgi:hypothetical protein